MSLVHPLLVFPIVVGLLLAGAFLLHLIPRLGGVGKAVSRQLCEGIPLDLVVGWFTVLPLIVGPILAGWAGLFVAIAAQYASLIAWTFGHELLHWKTVGRSSILRANNRLVGGLRNILAVYWTSLAVPVFVLVRLAEHFVYPPVALLCNMPKYDHGRWVNVTRHKFDGLVGHDRIWCLYCDWMTGVWSLGTEMLRNIESFWCPIRFGDHAKCENCAIDFPDINGGWVDFDGHDARDAGRVLDEQYAGPGPNGWFGRGTAEQPVRLRTPNREGGAFDADFHG